MSYNRWPDYRCRRRMSFLFVFGSLPVILGIMTAVEGTSGVLIFPFLIVAMFVGIVVTSFRAAGFHCPRCGELYFSRGLYHHAFARRCLHCKLPKWREGE